MIRDELLSLDLPVEYLTAWPDFFEHYRSIWITLGNGSDLYSINFDENTELNRAIEAGTDIYLECGNCWSNPERFNSFAQFGIRATGANVDDLGTIQGIAGEFTEGMAFEYPGDTIGQVANTRPSSGIREGFANSS